MSGAVLPAMALTVSYSQEATQMVDGSPTLVQPAIVCSRWTGFVPYSWEIGMDWAQLESELVRLISDGRDVNDATMFYSGAGSASFQPLGIANSLGTTQQVVTVGTAALAAGDLWALKEAIPPRFQPNSTYVAHPSVLDKVYRLVPNASTSEPALMESRDGALMGRPVGEWSAPSASIVRLAASYAYLDTDVTQSLSSGALTPSFNPKFPGIPIGNFSPLLGQREFRRPPNTGNLFASYTQGPATVALSGYFAGKSDDSTFLGGSDLNFGNSLLLPNEGSQCRLPENGRERLVGLQFGR